jgi:galactoside O-acetyltransferase
MTYQQLRKKVRKLFGIHYTIDRTARLHDRRVIRLAKGALITEGVIIRAHEHLVSVGEHSQIGPYTVILGGVGVTIGNMVMIGPHCVLAAGSHDFVQTEKPMRFAGNLARGPIVIEDDVWIGANCTITDGVRIGRGAVVGANSVVTRDVAPYDIVGGAPARAIGNRLEKIKAAA